MPDRRAAMTLLLGLALASPARADDEGRLERHTAVPSRFVRPRDVAVWLPPGYDAGARRYPVLYMHDGQNLFSAGEAYLGQTWGVAPALAGLVARGEAEPAIIVGVYNTPLRLREYVPAAVFERLPAPVQARVASEYGGAPLSDGYVRFLAEELKPLIDRTYRTRPERRQTALMGSSMGGLISLYALAERPDVFGAAAGLSTHWPLVVADAVTPDGGRDAEAVTAAHLAWLDEVLPRLKGRRLYLDRGDRTLDALYAPYLNAIRAELAAKGRGLVWETRAFPGAAHDEAAWRARVDVPLRFLLGRTR